MNWTFQQWPKHRCFYASIFFLLFKSHINGINSAIIWLRVLSGALTIVLQIQSILLISALQLIFQSNVNKKFSTSNFQFNVFFFRSTEYLPPLKLRTMWIRSIFPIFEMLCKSSFLPWSAASVTGNPDGSGLKVMNSPICWRWLWIAHLKCDGCRQ